MNRIPFIIIIFSFTSVLFSGHCFSQPLFPVKVKGLWGAIDSMGKIVVEPKYSGEMCAIDPGNSFLRVLNKKSSIIINSRGTEVIRADYTIRTYLGCGLFEYVKDTIGHSGLAGIIDTNGKIIVGPKYVYIQKFEEKTADACYLTDQKDKFGNYKQEHTEIDTAGNFVTIERYYEGLHNFWVEGKGWGAKDKAGTIIIQPKYNRLLGCKNGVMIYSQKTRYRSGLVDRYGNEVIPDDGKKVVEYSPRCETDTLVIVWKVKGEGVTAVYEKPDIYTIHGKFLFHCKAPVSMYMANGMFLLQDDDGKRGMMDGTGKVLVKPQYKLVEWYVGGDRIPVTTYSGKEGFVDRSGKEVIACIYDAVGHFDNGTGSYCNGLALVKLKQGSSGYDLFQGEENNGVKTAYINRDGKVIWPVAK